MSAHREAPDGDSAIRPMTQLRLEDLMTVVRRRLGLIALCALVTASAAVGVSLLEQRIYSASAGLLFRDAGLDQTLFGAAPATPSGDRSRDAATNVKLISLEVVAARTAQALGGGLTARDIQDHVTVAAEGQSDLVSVTATASDPKLAARLAETFCEEFIVFRREADRAKIRDAEQLLQQQINALPGQQTSKRRRALASRAEQLQILASLQTGNVELVQPAVVPDTASSPRPVRAGIVGLGLGLLLGLATALLLNRTDRRIGESDDFELILGQPLLGRVPLSKALTSPRLVKPPPAEGDVFRMLLARLKYFNAERDIRRLLVTSSRLGDGKSVIARHLAMIAAQDGARVLLVETDLRRPSLARAAGLPTEPGLAEVLTQAVPLAAAVRRLHAHVWSDKPPSGVLDVLVAGARPPSPAESLASRRVRTVLDDLADDHDLVIIDTPAISVVSDAIPLLGLVDGVIVVGRLGKSRSDDLARLGAELVKLGAPVLGVVVNAVPVNRRAWQHYTRYTRTSGAALLEPARSSNGTQRERSAT